MDNCLKLDNSNESHLPPGFRFHPTDEELITYYLLKKVLDPNFTCKAISEVDFNKCEPWELPEKAEMGEKEWYFFSLGDRKYPTGLRTNRATEAGYWKSTGKDREIYSSKTGSLLGMKKTLVFYGGRAPKGEKSNWVMHEYRLEGKLSYHYLSRTSRDERVISRVFKKSNGNGGCCAGKKLGFVNYAGGVGCYSSDIGSPSSNSLPPLLDSSSAGFATTDQEISCSNYESNNNTRKHVPCFSTTNIVVPDAVFVDDINPLYGTGNSRFGSSSSATSNMIINAGAVGTDPINQSGGNGHYHLNYPTGLFPSLRSLQDNLYFPNFFSSSSMSTVVAAPLSDHSYHPEYQNNVNNSWVQETMQPMVERGRMPLGRTELDCMWT